MPDVVASVPGVHLEQPVHGHGAVLGMKPRAPEGGGLERSKDGVQAAVRASQQQKIKYRGFCERIAEAGCVGYMVSIPGKRAVYYGRTGETYVEMFPGAA